MAKKKKDDEVIDYGKTKIPITSEIFQLIRDLLLSDNNNIHLRDVLDIRRFFSIIDFDKYTNAIENIPAKDYLTFLNELVEASLDNNTISRLIVIQNLLNESKDREKFKTIYDNRKEISNEDILHLKKFMSEHVSASYIFSGADKLSDLITKIKSGTYENISEVVDEYKNFITTTYRDLASVKIKEKDEKLDSGLDTDSLMSLVTETIKEISTPGFYLNTGFANLDKAMGGGLKRGALTLFGARTSGFKSGIMLNLACSIKMFSKNLETFDKTKIPAVIYLSLENTQTETCKRIITYATGKTPSQLVNGNPSEIIGKLKETLNCSTSNPKVDLRIMYRKSNTTTINDIYNMISDVESQGYEVVALFVDYISTMKSLNYNTKDQQSVGLAMADNARELYDLAISKNIAVVSGFQLNREAYNKDKELSGKETLKLVGESYKMVTYADYVFTINKETATSADGSIIMDYIRFDEAKQRSNMGSIKGYFYEIFKNDNNFRLIHSKYYKKEDGSEINFDKFDEFVKAHKDRLKQESQDGKQQKTINRAPSIGNIIPQNKSTSNVDNLDTFLNMSFDNLN